RHVHVARAFAFARLARQAQVHDVGDPAFAHFRLDAAVQGNAKGIGASAGGAVAGAHRAALRLAADADAVAQFNAAEEAALWRIIEGGGNLGRRPAGRHAEVLFHRRT